MKSTLAAALAVAGVSALEGHLEQQFVMWAVKFGRQYRTLEEYGERLEHWLKTHYTIESFNALPDQTQTMAHNRFSDWSTAEYREFLTYRPKALLGNLKPVLLDESNTPDAIDWIEKGAVNEVQDQGQCGSCWAFSAVASMEGMHFTKSGELLKLSEQQCVDCDPDSYGCSGGWQDNCMWYVFDNGGISLEEDYPYKAIDQMCVADWNGPVSVSMVNPVKSYSESQLLAALAIGPVSVTVDADSAYFRNYSTGVITSEDCGTKLDHAITAVGFGTDENGVDYYLVRNSWGKDWGDKGYLKIGRNGDGYGICGIQEISVYPTTN